MRAWREEKKFLSLLESDSEVTAYLPEGELKSLFDYQYYLKHVDEIFEHAGLAAGAAKGKVEDAEAVNMAPRAV
jgi:hypothetical protein